MLDFSYGRACVAIIQPLPAGLLSRALRVACSLSVSVESHLALLWVRAWTMRRIEALPADVGLRCIDFRLVGCGSRLISPSLASWSTRFPGVAVAVLVGTGHRRLMRWRGGRSARVLG